MFGRSGSSVNLPVLIAAQGLLIVLAASFSTVREVVIPTALYALVGLGAACCAGTYLKRKIEVLKPVFYVLAGGGAVVSGVALLSAVFVLFEIDLLRFAVRNGSYLFGLPRVHSLFSNPNTMGLFLFFSIAASLVLLFLHRKNREPNKVVTSLLWVLLPLQAAALLITFSRAAFLAVTVFFAIYLWFNARRFFYVSLVMLAPLLAYVINAVLYSRTIGQIMILLLNGRVELWSAAFREFLQHPLLGVGPGGWTTVSGQLLPVHNTYLQIAVELGVFGLLACLTTMFLFLRGMRRSRAKVEKGSIRYMLISGLYAMSLGLFVHQLFESHLYYGLPFYLMFMVVSHFLTLESKAVVYVYSPLPSLKIPLTPGLVIFNRGTPRKAS